MFWISNEKDKLVGIFAKEGTITLSTSWLGSESILLSAMKGNNPAITRTVRLLSRAPCNPVIEQHSILYTVAVFNVGLLWAIRAGVYQTHQSSLGLLPSLYPKLFPINLNSFHWTKYHSNIYVL